jgi:PHD/YefM family antitoxin component YafN of YafNO toxin-antitoxin module
MIGLGEMGMPMLERLRAAGHDVTFRARRPEVVERAAVFGANTLSTRNGRAAAVILSPEDLEYAATTSTGRLLTTSVTTSRNMRYLLRG